MIKDRINSAYEYLKKKKLPKPDILLVLGSGLGDYADQLDIIESIAYTDIPGFPEPTVPGHSGNLVFCKKKDKVLVVMQGRFHCYEGYSPQEVTIPLRALIKIGIKSVMFTNAAGGVNLAYQAGDIMMITDHINLAGLNPLVGKNLDDFGPRFCDMSYAYDKELSKMLSECAKKQELALKCGVYCMFSGPSFETAAEIKMARTMGADAVGMSTVPEVIVCNHANIPCVGISCITNLAAGILDQPLTHDEVLETGKQNSEKMKNLLDMFLDSI